MRIKKSTGEIAFNVINTVVLIILGLTTLLPFIHLVSVSISESHFVQSGNIGLLPKGFNIAPYKYVIHNPKILSAYSITILVTVVGTIISILVTSLMAYPLGKKDLVGRKVIMKLIIFTMIFNGGLVPNYILIRNLGLINSVWSMILPVAVSAWNLIILKNFFQSIPESLEEAANIDGCSDIGILFKIIIPLSLPAISTIALFYAVPYWNTFMSAVMYINKADRFPLQVFLRQLVVAGDTGDLASVGISGVSSEALKAASIMAATIPILLVYPFIQNYFVKGVMVGSIKE